MTIINALPFDLQNGTTADATQVMADFDEIVNDVNNNAAHNGANNDITSLTGLTTPIAPAGGGSSIFFGAGGGTANAQTVATTSPTGFTLAAGNSVYWLPSVSNTGAMTLTANGTTVTAVMVKTSGGVEPTIGGEVTLGVLAKATYDGTQYVLDMDPMVGFGPLVTLASATTTDLGTAGSHTVAISGTTTITAFGATALAQRPIYMLQFNGILTITYDAVAMILPGSTSITTQPGDFAIAKYIGVGAGNGNWRILAYYRQSGQPLALPAVLLQNYIAGLVLSTAGGSGTFGIAAGEATDSTNAVVINFASAFTKTTASWVAGSGNGGLDTGSIAINTWYHVFLIQNPTTGVIDIVFSATATPAAGPTTPPSGFTLFRRIGSMKTDGSSHWGAFIQINNQFLWVTSVAESPSFGSGSRTLNVLAGVPPGVSVLANLRCVYNSPGGASSSVITSPFESDQSPSTTFFDIAAGASGFSGGNLFRLTNTSAQLGFRSANGCTVNTYGWNDYRGT